MESTALHGTTEDKHIVSWVANLMMQRGLFYASNADIELGHADLVDYFVSQGVAEDPSTTAALLDRAMAANAYLFGRRDTPDGAVFWIAKKQLLSLLQAGNVPEPPAASQPAAPRAKAAPPASAGEKEPRPTRKRRAEPKVEADEAASLDDLPVTRQYQLAVLRALHELGGSGKAALIVDMIPTLMELPVEHQGTYARGPEGKSEEAKYVKFVHSARRFLIQQDELTSPQRGIWAITEAGAQRLKDAGVIE
jgi:hypothetical protein